MDSIHQLLLVRVESVAPVGILGEHTIEVDKIVFKPLIPFSRGLNYEIIFRNRQIGKIKIPVANEEDAGSVSAVYPTMDTLPENLLKLYLQFSHPMREGQSQKYITLLNNRNDTIPNVFLDLQPELWNEERTVLTIWLDPGRIKRDLIPNQKMGNPIKKGERYTLAISANWKDVQGLNLSKSFTKQFLVGSRDSLSPGPNKWTLDLPSAGTNQPLTINFGEPLDYFLLQETIQIVDVNGKRIATHLQIGNKERKLEFIPKQQWKAGRYRLQILSHLEDLSGNNLKRPFDRDISLPQPTTDKLFVEREFVITTH